MNTKQMADLITYARAAGAPVLAGWGLAEGPATLPWAAAFLLADWVGDMVDGALARRSPAAKPTWIGEHDLEVDMWVAGWLLAYLALAGLVSVKLAAAYLVSSILILAAAGWSRSLSMACQAPIYAGLMIISVEQAPVVALGLMLWPVMAIVVTWPRFPKVVVPGFLAGLRHPGHPTPGSHRQV